jgi:hypothetical protein
VKLTSFRQSQFLNEIYSKNLFLKKTKCHKEGSGIAKAILLWGKVFSKKRLLSKIGTVNKEEFKIILSKLKRLIDPTEVGLPEGEL